MVSNARFREPGVTEAQMEEDHSSLDRAGSATTAPQLRGGHRDRAADLWSLLRFIEGRPLPPG
ncbi:hypothetical protein BSL82_17350 [Tardibacter chloracetimidivorans]|uniref:Uncharacterized protein n=1 Tax=Tardibacter chloracetimidivorans TaxID=1921510 RepID=A0A1L3ZZ07_9SPHN|nr:hypothetical protein BSL82_17350 [Tardibacter chloracetimidivorans]